MATGYTLVDAFLTMRGEDHVALPYGSEVELDDERFAELEEAGAVSKKKPKARDAQADAPAAEVVDDAVAEDAQAADDAPAATPRRRR